MDISRRDLAALFALAGLELYAQPEATGSLYTPKAHNVADRKLLHDFMDEFSFVDLVTAVPGIRITHIPTWLDRGSQADRTSLLENLKGAEGDRSIHDLTAGFCKTLA